MTFTRVAHMIKEGVVVLGGALIAASACPLAIANANAAGPTPGTPCDDMDNIVATGASEIIFAIVGAGPLALAWPRYPRSRPRLEFGGNRWSGR